MLAVVENKKKINKLNKIKKFIECGTPFNV